jgi:hypothetical protein
MTYKLVITSGSGPSRKVESKEYWMTQVGLHQAEAEFEKLQRRQEIMKLVLWRVDINGVHDLKRWERNGNKL